MCDELKPNSGKNLYIEVGGRKYARFPIKTHIITEEDDLLEVCKRYAGPHLREGDILFVSEKIVAIIQKRAFPIKDIKPSPLAKLLVKFVHKSPYGIGLGSPWTMELALREAGVWRILIGALVAGVTKPFGIHGLFYRIVGKNISAIDGPCDYTLPPYNQYAILGPAEPDKVAKMLSLAINHDVVIIDANDLGIAVLGKSNKHISDNFCKDVFRDNPIGQSSERTPLCIVREMENEDLSSGEAQRKDEQSR